MTTAIAKPENVREIQNECSRDHWIAASAAARIAECEPLETIETEPLEALADWINFELIDRSERNGHAEICR